MKYYLIFVEDNIEPTIVGPFESGEHRDAVARDLRNKYGSDHGLFPLDINNKEMPRISTYSNKFFTDDF